MTSELSKYLNDQLRVLLDVKQEKRIHASPHLANTHTPKETCSYFHLHLGIID